MSNPDLERIIENSRQWRDSRAAEQADFFQRSAEGQSPGYLWIGCVDSRVPVEVICGLGPGDMLTHRNVANQFQVDDTNTNAIIEFGVGALKIPNIVVCGHTACGGIKAAIAQAGAGSGDSSSLSQWITPLATLYSENQTEFEKIDESGHANRLAEISVKAQVQKLAASAPAQNAWASGQPLSIHGVMYDLATGTLSDLGISQSSS